MTDLIILGLRSLQDLEAVVEETFAPTHGIENCLTLRQERQKTASALVGLTCKPRHRRHVLAAICGMFAALQ